MNPQESRVFETQQMDSGWIGLPMKFTYNLFLKFQIGNHRISYPNKSLVWQSQFSSKNLEPRRSRHGGSWKIELFSTASHKDLCLEEIRPLELLLIEPEAREASLGTSRRLSPGSRRRSLHEEASRGPEGPDNRRELVPMETLWLAFGCLTKSKLYTPQVEAGRWPSGPSETQTLKTQPLTRSTFTIN